MTESAPENTVVASLSGECAIPILTVADERVSVGRFTYGTPQLKMWSESEGISIGAFCSIADEVLILGGGEHNTDWVTTYPLRIALSDPAAGKDGHPASKGSTVIGNDVWIGTRAVILSGVKIGDGAVIGAGAVVAGDVGPYEIVAGNPAKTIRPRFQPDQVDALLRIAWWDWPLDKIRQNASYLCGNDIEGFIRRCHE